MKHDKKFYLIRSIAASIVIFSCTIILLVSLINARESNLMHERNLKSLQTVSNMADYVRYSIETRLMILKGYEVYVMTDPGVTEDFTLEYLKNLVNGDPLIRNIGIIKDTTIIFNYPKETNIKAIGVDLATVPNQRDAILKVKESLEPVFLGPVDLVQGGRGFIARTPIVVDGVYWGQISIVLRADEIEKMFLDYATERNLKIAMFNGSPEEKNLIIGNADILKQQPIFNTISIMETEYTIAAIESVPAFSAGSRGVSLSLAIAAALLMAWLTYYVLMKNAQIKFQASIDSLTNVHNRSYLDFFIKGLFGREKVNLKRIGIVEMDIDDFKSINDNYGHQAGDAALKIIASSLQALCRKTETIFRMGGDEFLIIFNDIGSQESFDIIMDRILKGLPRVLHYRGHDIPLSMSFGSALFPEDGEHFEELFRHADRQMYENKKTKSR